MLHFKRESARPNLLVNLTSYGKRREPGLRQLHHRCTPDLQRARARAG